MKLGLVLGGGTAKGAFQLGALKALADVFPPESFTCISTSSVGIMNGYSFATGQLKEAEQIWRDIKFSGLPGFARFVRRPDYFETMFAPLKDTRVPVPFYTMYLTLPKLKLHYVNLQDMEPEEYRTYLKAGVAIPPFCRPVTVNGEKSIDGALVDNIPVMPALQYGCDYIIAIYFDEDDYQFVSPEVDRKVMRLNVMDQGIIRDTFTFNQEFISSLMEMGEETCRKKLETWAPLIRAGEPIPEGANGGAGGQRKRKWYTGDMLLNRVNMAAKKFTGYQIDGMEEKK